MSTIVLWDETTAGARTGAGELAVEEDRLPLREVIRRRVFEEVARFERESLGASPKSGPRHTSDPEEQYAAAVKAFARNGFVVLVGDRQIEDLDELLDLRTDTEIVFLKLVALVGG
ncbi:hypothetical protein OG216_43860 [Streptomycetaceae bacterium NBC_01309]